MTDKQLLTTRIQSCKRSEPPSVFSFDLRQDALLCQVLHRLHRLHESLQADFIAIELFTGDKKLLSAALLAAAAQNCSKASFKDRATAASAETLEAAVIGHVKVGVQLIVLLVILVRLKYVLQTIVIFSCELSLVELKALLQGIFGWVNRRDHVIFVRPNCETGNKYAAKEPNQNNKTA